MIARPPTATLSKPNCTTYDDSASIFLYTSLYLSYSKSVAWNILNK